MNVAFKELAGSPVENYGLRGIKSERRVLCAWEDRQALTTQLLGSGYSFGSATPQAPYPGSDNVVAMQVKIEPFEARPDDAGQFTDITAQLNSYSGQFALVTITYELLVIGGLKNHTPNTPGGTYLTYRMDFSSQTMTMPGQSLQWESDQNIPVPPESVPILRVPVIEHHLTWHLVPNPPWDAVRNCVGCVNQSDFLGAAAETVLFDGATAEKQFVSLDQTNAPQYAWKLTYLFREKAIKYPAAPGSPPETFGWNHAYRSLPYSAPGFDRLLDTNGNTLYCGVDFSPLFSFDPDS
jgi:hypothetical protein